MSQPHSSSVKFSRSQDSPDDIRSSTLRLGSQPTRSPESQAPLSFSMDDSTDVLSCLGIPSLEKPFYDKENSKSQIYGNETKRYFTPTNHKRLPNLTLKPRYDSASLSLSDLPLTNLLPETPVVDAMPLSERRPWRALIKKRDPNKRNAFRGPPTLPILRSDRTQAPTRSLIRPKCKILQEQAEPINLRPYFDIAGTIDEHMPFPTARPTRAVSAAPVVAASKASNEAAHLVDHPVSSNSSIVGNDDGQFTPFELSLLDSLASGTEDLALSVIGERSLLQAVGHVRCINKVHDSGENHGLVKKPHLSYHADQLHPVGFLQPLKSKRSTETTASPTPPKGSVKKTKHVGSSVALATPPPTTSSFQGNNTLEPPPIVRTAGAGQPPLIRRITTTSSIEPDHNKSGGGSDGLALSFCLLARTM